MILCGAHPAQDKSAVEASSRPTPPTSNSATQSELKIAAQPATDFTPYPGYNPDPCYNVKDHNAADLCAQWRAALAAERAAHEDRRAVNWSIVATFLSGIAVLGLFVTILQTTGALKEARRANILAMRENARATRRALASTKETASALDAASSSAAAANKHAEIAERSVLVQLRSYLVVDKIRIAGIPQPDKIYVEIFIKNVGMTPARIADVKCAVWAGAATIDPIQDGPSLAKYYHLLDWLPQGGESVIFEPYGEAESISKLNAEDQFNLYVCGRIEYTDVFNHRHWMTFAYRPDGWGIASDTTFSPCIHGNDGD